MSTAAFSTPPQLARQLGVKPDKVVAWIRSGELQAVNVAQSQDGRPRWRVSDEAWADFLARRSCSPAPKPAPRRRRKAEHVIKFY
jgi:hypothetical protein